MNNFNLGKYIAFAANDPKKYPKKPFLEQAEESKRAVAKMMSAEQMEKMARRNTLILGGKIQ